MTEPTRPRLLRKDEEGGQYFNPSRNIEFIPSGCVLLDCVLGGGYPLGRIVNIVGDHSSGKTLLGIEACANFARDYPTGKIVYGEAEAAFDLDYASALGLPVDTVEFVEDNIFTVEDFYDDLEKRLKDLGEDEPLLYVLDSLDALSDAAELERGIREGSYGMTKQKKLGELFRRLVQHLKKKRACLIIISQVRENIGVSFGEKYRRSGGKALDFYASQVLWLSQIKTEKRMIKKQERAYGVRIKANCKKNKIAEPRRTCEFLLRFGFGVDDVQASLEWLHSLGELDEIQPGLADSKALKKYLDSLEKLSDEDYGNLQQKATGLVRNHWAELEQRARYGRNKYK